MKAIGMTALEYWKIILPDLLFPPHTEEDALAALIDSHARQRIIIGEDTHKWITSEEGKRWAEKVSAMSFEEVIELTKNKRERQPNE